MNNIFKFLLALMGVTLMLNACQKDPALLNYQSARGVEVSLNNVEFRPVVRDSNAFPLKVSWTNGEFSTDFANVKYITQVDYRGNNFANPIERTTFGTLRDSMQNKVINAFVLERGTAPAAFAELELRVISSFSNNNERRISTPVPFRFRAYRVPPRVALPTTNRLFIVGDATNAWWNLPLINNTTNIDYSISQEFIRVNETTYAAKVFLFGGNSYLLVPRNDGGGWDLKYAAPKPIPANSSLSGTFGHRPSSPVFDDNFPSPAEDGWYKMTFDFQSGFYSVEDSRDTPVPDSLYAIGDGTLGGWDNSHGNNNLKAQYFNKLNSGIFERNLNLTGGLNLKFITKITQWQPQFGRGSANGQLGFNYGGGSDPGTISIPAASGMYRVRVDFLNMTYTLTKL